MKTITLLTFTLYFSLNVHAQWTNNSNVTTSNIGIGIVPENPLHVYKTTGGRVFSTESGGTNTGISIKGTAKTYELWTSSSIPNNGFGIYDYNAKKYRISIDGSNGNVGIGLNNPQQPLDVNNTLRVSFGDNLQYGNVELGATSGTRARSGSIYFNSYVNEYNSTQAIQAAYIGYTNDDYLYYETSNGRAHSFGGGNVEIDNELMLGGAFSPGNNAGTSGQLLQSTGSATTPIWVDSAATTAKFVDGTDPLNAVFLDGNVGIGTSTPSEKLEVIGTVRASSSATSTTSGYVDLTSNSSNNSGWVDFYNWDGAAFDRAGYIGYANDTEVSYQNYDDRNHTFGGGNVVAERDLLVTGNVGVGTGTPTANLEVLGTIRTSVDSGNQTGHIEMKSASGTRSGSLYFYDAVGDAGTTATESAWIGWTSLGYLYYKTNGDRVHYFDGGNVEINKDLKLNGAFKPERGP